ncbi:MAG: recN [Thermoleophilia bacterium]|nr:recN [Thermoleophilia bacterium]
MIVRVDIENLVIVEHAEFAPGPGLTAITGETGAGKTLLATAIDLLFGGDADAGQVGPGASQAWVEGEFDVDDAFWSQPEVATLAELRPESDASLVLARRVDASGRSRALAWGRTVTKGDLAAAGRLLIATAGQHVQVRLRSSEHQRHTLDRTGDAAHAALLDEVREAVAAWNTAHARRVELEELARDGAARIEVLRDDLARIDAVGPSVEDEAELVTRRDRARHHAAIVEALASAGTLLDGGGSDGGVIDLAGRAYAELDRAATVDPELAELAAMLLDAQATLTDVAGTIGSRLGDLSEGPGSLDEIEDRLAAYDELKRRHGGTVESVLAAWETLREQVDAIDDTGGTLDAARTAEAATQAAADAAAARLTASRCALADQLVADVRESLDELGMSGSVFRVGVEEAPLAGHGADRIELLLAPAEGIEPRPVAQVASGGELSRIALALLVATTRSSDRAQVGTILFDEIDAGIGGHTAHAVASMLRRLADHRQVLCITHLPQVAARADAHVVIEKSDAGSGVRTSLHALSGEDAVVDELVRMLGADATDDAAREHARQLRGPRFFSPTDAGATAR